MDFTTFKVRCSAISKVMSNSRSNPTLTDKQEEKLNTYRDKLDAGGSLTPNQQAEMAELEIKEANKGKVILSDSCIEYLTEEYAWITKGRKSLKDRMELQQLKKGKMVQTDSVTLLSVVEGQLYTENTERERIYNDYLSGEVDAYLGEQIMGAQVIVDLKNSIDYPTFLKKINCGLENGNEQQVQGYQDISGCGDAYIVHALVNMPEIMRLDYKRKLFYETPGKYISEESPDFLREWAELERDMVFDDIPMTERIFKVKVEPFTPQEQQKLYDRVKIVRDWLCIFHEKYVDLNK